MANQIEPLYARARSHRRGVDWVGRYVLALENSGGSFKKAAEAARVAYSTVWERRKIDPAFALSEDDAVKRAQRLLESEAVRRAMEGTKRIRFQPKTGKIYHDIEFSDALLLRLLEKNETGSWRRNHVVEQRNEFCFATRAERKAALEKARAEIAHQESVKAAPGAAAKPSVGIPDGSGIASLRGSVRVDSVASASNRPISAITAGKTMSNALDRKAWRASGVAKTRLLIPEN